MDSLQRRDQNIENGFDGFSEVEIYALSLSEGQLKELVENYKSSDVRLKAKAALEYQKQHPRTVSAYQ